jgi:hypothetical protein
MMQSATSRPLIVSVPHRLGRQEAMRRLDRGIGRLQPLRVRNRRGEMKQSVRVAHVLSTLALRTYFHIVRGLLKTAGGVDCRATILRFVFKRF